MPTTITIGEDVLDADAVLREDYVYPAEVTAHPVEQGVDLADHVRPGSLTAELELLITETPTRTPAFGLDGAAARDGLGVLAFDRPFNRARAIVDRLRRAQVEAELCTVTSARRGEVTQLAVVEAREPYEHNRGVVVSVRLQQVRVATVRTVAIPPTLQDRGKKKRDRGKQPAVEAGPTRGRSLAANLLGYGKSIEDDGL